MNKFFYACRSTAGGRPRCKGISYPAWEIERAVREMFDEPQMWCDLLGPDIPENAASEIAATWRVLPWPWQRDWLKESITRIELNEDDSTITLTFAPDAAKPFLDQIGGPNPPSANQ